MYGKYKREKKCIDEKGRFKLIFIKKMRKVN